MLGAGAPQLLGDKQSVPGRTLTLTLDRKLQKAASDALQGKGRRRGGPLTLARAKCLLL